MPSTGAPAVHSSQHVSQKSVNKLPAGRVLPVIPRQLVRPRGGGATVAAAGKAEQLRKTDVVAQDEGVSDKVEEKNGRAGEDNKEEEQQEEAVAQAQRVNGWTKAEKHTSADAGVENVATSQSEKSNGLATEQVSVPSKSPRASLKSLSTKPLPPPFYPRESQQSLSATSATFSPHSAQNISSTGPHYHSTQPSVSSIAFGGYVESANPSPAPPGNAGSMFLPPGVPHGAAVQPPYLPTGHSSHHSASFYPQFTSYDARYDPYHPPPPFSPFGPTSQHPHLPNAVTTPHYNRSVNGAARLSRSPSQASSGVPGMVSDITPPGVHYNGAQGPAPFYPGQNQMHPSQEIKAFQDMRNYLLSQFGNIDFADYIFELARRDSSVPVSIPVHGLMLARSSGLYNLLHSALNGSEDRSSSPRHVRVPTHFYYSDPDAFVDALRYLYGGDMLDPVLLMHTFRGSQHDDVRQRMEYVLSYIAAGVSMNITDIEFRGLELATRLASWDTLESLFSFCLNGGYGATAHHILRVATDFVALNVPADFTLDTSVRQLRTVPRLPDPPLLPPSSDERASVVIEPRARRNSRRAEGIRFGEVPATFTHDFPFGHDSLSAILLTLPFDILKPIAEHPELITRLGVEKAAQTFRAVIAEREKRRVEALDAHRGSSEGSRAAMSPLLTDAMFWRETLEQREPGHAFFLEHRRLADAGVVA